MAIAFDPEREPIRRYSPRDLDRYQRYRRRFRLAITLIANTGASSGDGNSVTTSSIDTSGANFLVVSGGFSTGTSPTISDNKSNSWTTTLTSRDSGGPKGQLYYVANATVGTGHTFTLSQGGSFPSLCVAAFSAVKTSSPFDQETGANSTSATTLQAVAVDPSEDNCLIIYGSAHEDTGTVSIDSGMTITNQRALAGGAAYGSALAYKVQTTHASINAIWTFTGSIHCTLEMAVFKAAAAASRTALNTRSNPLGVEIGMGWRMDL